MRYVWAVRAASLMTCLKLDTYGNEVQGKGGRGKPDVDAVRFGTAVRRGGYYSD